MVGAERTIVQNRSICLYCAPFGDISQMPVDKRAVDRVSLTLAVLRQSALVQTNVGERL